MLIGEPEDDDAGIFAWEASIEDDEGALDAVTLTLNQFPGEPPDGMAEQLLRLARLSGGSSQRT